MSNRMHHLVMLATLVSSGNVGIALGQTPANRTENKNPSKSSTTPQPDFSLKVAYDKKKVPAAQVKLFEKVNDRLNQARIGVPDDRVAHFRTVINPNSNPVCGWNGIIESIVPVKSGVVVEVRIHAKQESEMNSSYHIERYSIINDKVLYRGSYVPPQDPPFVIGF